MERKVSNVQNYRICTKCITDASIPGITFDHEGVCNFCKLHDKMNKLFPDDQRGLEILNKLSNKIKKSSQGKNFNCIVGVSGGRDSTYTLYYIKKVLGLSPLAVHFNDGFGNPIAGENMVKTCKILDVPLRTITSDWRESKEIKLAFLKASVPDVLIGTDIGIATALYGVAAKENIKHVFIGQSFRTEGIAPLSWNYLDGKYLKAVYKQFGKYPLRKWKPEDPGFNLDIKEMFYYVILKGIKTIPILYYLNYVRKDIDKLIEKEFDWQNPGAHYFDDLYQSLATNILRVKFNCDRRLFNYSALVRSGQMSRDEAIEKTKSIYTIEDPKIINLCLKRLAISEEDFNSYLKLPPKSFRDYPNNYNLLLIFKPAIWVMSRLNLLPASAYDKYFNCGK